jgi:hypothetical protein
MAEPNSRKTFTDFCLRKLGYPVIEINIDPDQVQDRIDESIRWFWDYHFDGVEKIYYSYIPTANDILNTYITLPDNINGAVQVFPIGDPSVRADDLFNIRYQIALNDLYTLTSVSMTPYYMVMEHLALVTEFIVGQQPIRYNRLTNQLWIDTDWTTFGQGQFLMIECYQTIDPNVYTKMWRDRMLQQYAVASLREQWGANLMKFQGMKMPGGVEFNGEKIYLEGKETRERLEKEVIENYSLPCSDFVG